MPLNYNDVARAKWAKTALRETPQFKKIAALKPINEATTHAAVVQVAESLKWSATYLKACVDTGLIRQEASLKRS